MTWEHLLSHSIVNSIYDSFATLVQDDKNKSDTTGYYNITNFSNKRNASAVWSEGNDLTHYQDNYYVKNVPITMNLNLENEDLHGFIYDKPDIVWDSTYN
jgi:hypothetical protein